MICAVSTTAKRHRQHSSHHRLNGTDFNYHKPGKEGEMVLGKQNKPTKRGFLTIFSSSKKTTDKGTKSIKEQLKSKIGKSVAKAALKKIISVK